MAMGTRKDQEQQEEMWIPQASLAKGASHLFYQRLNQLLEECRFDEFVEGRCRRFYAAKRGRPSLPPGVYFRLLLIGYLEGIDSERGIAWRSRNRSRCVGRSRNNRSVAELRRLGPRPPPRTSSGGGLEAWRRRDSQHRREPSWTVAGRHCHQGPGGVFDWEAACCSKSVPKV